MAYGLGGIALVDLLNPISAMARSGNGELGGALDFAPKAKPVIFLFQSGGPSQIELFDDKPRIRQDLGMEFQLRAQGTAATPPKFGMLTLSACDRFG